MIRIFAVASALCLPATAHAALSGYWDSAKVLHAILGSDELADGLKQQPIVSIEETGDGYRIRSADCQVDVTVVRTEAQRPGPRPFRLVIGKGSCR